MATVRMSLEEAAASGSIDPAKVDAFTEDDIARFHVEDGLELDGSEVAPAEMMSPAEIRLRLGITQAVMAERLGIPLRTWRNWEQERVALEPTVRVLLKLLSIDPEDVFRKLSGFKLALKAKGHLNRLVQETDDSVEARAMVTTVTDPITEEEIARLNAIVRGRDLDEIVERMRAKRG